jgi:hypothetical protein
MRRTTAMGQATTIGLTLGRADSDLMRTTCRRKSRRFTVRLARRRWVDWEELIGYF